MKAHAAAAVLAALMTFCAGAASAQVDFPSRAVTLVVPYAAGGPTDVNARILAPALALQLGKPVVVENRGGAGTTIGTGAVARAAPDGYTLLFADIGLAVSHLITHVDYDPARDFAPIALVSRSLLALVVSPDVPVTTLAEFAAYARAHPDTLQYGSAGPGTPPHLGGLALAKATGSTMVHVPYKGSGPAVSDLVGHQISFMFLGASVAASHVGSGRLRALAVTGDKRSATLPGVPTFRESGMQLGGIDFGTWWGVVAPAKTPPVIVERLNRAINAALHDPAVQQKFEALDITVVGGSPEEFGAFLKAQRDDWQQLAPESTR